MNWRRAAVLIGTLVICGNIRGGEDEAVNPWSASISTGWDSLYMYRGVNQLPGYKGYGSGISWTSVSLTRSLSDSDFLTVESWTAFGIGDSDYKEVDGTFCYTHSFGDLSLSAQYSLYAVLSSPNALYCHELSVSAGRSFTLGSVVITPALSYAFTLGPSPQHGGYVNAGSGYVELRIDSEIPIFRDIIRVAPWIAAGFNFGYNSRETNGDPEPFSGANHLEAGIALPIAVMSGIEVSPYIACSHQWAELPGTRPETFWGGVSVTFEF